jgi:hypothetical protein
MTKYYVHSVAPGEKPDQQWDGPFTNLRRARASMALSAQVYRDHGLPVTGNLTTGYTVGEQGHTWFAHVHIHSSR